MEQVARIERTETFNLRVAAPQGVWIEI